MSPEYLFVDLQGFNLNKEFIIKEFAYSTNDYTQVFLVKPPYAFSRLSENEKKQVRWLEKNYGILWSEGYIDYREFRRIIVSHLKDKKIFVKGPEKALWIRDLYSDCTIIELERKGYPNFKYLYEKYCTNDSTYNCVYHKKKCALKHVICIKKWSFDNNMFTFPNVVSY